MFPIGESNLGGLNAQVAGKYFAQRKATSDKALTIALKMKTPGPQQLFR